MHSWDDSSVDWKGIGDAAEYIATNLRRWGRVPVRDYKEKWGTIRIYLTLGWYSLHDITHPGYAYIQYKSSLLKYLNYASWMHWIFQGINVLIVPYHRYLYRRYYRRATERWPHLYKEIVAAADYGELFEGHIPGYKHSDYWGSADVS